MSLQTGIISYGCALPSYKLDTKEIAKALNNESLVNTLGINYRSVCDDNEDSLTLATAASLEALEKISLSTQQIKAVFTGSETHPFAVNPTSSYISSFLNLNPECFAADLQFACKAGTAASQITSAFIAAGQIEFGLAIGSDKGEGAPGDALGYTAGSGAAALIWGSANQTAAPLIAKLISTKSYTFNHPDFWRSQDSKFPEHAGRFSGFAYNSVLTEAIQTTLKSLSLDPKKIDHLALHAPNAKLPIRLANDLGFSEKGIQHSLLVKEIGNTYAANSLISLCNVLANAKPNELILVASYGSGSGSDIMLLETTNNIADFNHGTSLPEKIAKLTTIPYSKYLLSK